MNFVFFPSNFGYILFFFLCRRNDKCHIKLTQMRDKLETLYRLQKYYLIHTLQIV
jgi:hypothetical protein